jgi:NADH:ubiquinone oxidoreductase subunit 2 (subunit N)
MNAVTSLPVMAPATAEIFLAIVGALLLMFGVFRGSGGMRAPGWLAVLALLVAGILVVAKSGTQEAFFGLFITDAFARFAKVLILLGSAFALILSFGYFDRERGGRFEYPVLIVFSTLGMMMMVSANDLIALYMGLEMQSLALYVIASIRRDTLRSTEAGLKYFVLGALSSGMLLYGCSLVYGFAGTTSFTGLAEVFQKADGPSVGLVVGLVFLISGLAFALMVFMFSMAGIPPLAGFFGKWYVFMAAVNAGLFGLAVIGVLASVVGAFYYLRIVKIMYFDDATQPLDGAVAGDLRAVVFGSAVVTVLFLLFLSPVYEQARQAAVSLLGA